MRLNSLAIFLAAALVSAGCGPTTPAKHTASSGSTTGHVTSGSTTTTTGAGSTGTTGTNATTGVHLTTSGSSGTHTTTTGSGSSGSGTTTGGTHTTTTSGSATATTGTTSTTSTTSGPTSGTTGACDCTALNCASLGEVCDPTMCMCMLPSPTTGGTTGSGTTTGSSEVCGSKVGPDVAANCTCASGHTCAANNCYGGYWCDTSTNRCVAPPTNCGGSSTTTGGTTGSTTGSAGQLCSTCTQDSDCGTGGACALESANASVGYCALACTSSGGCADASATCADIFGDGSHYCYPTGGTCQSSGGTTGSTTGGGTGTECATCTQDSDCGAGGTCLQESATTFYCAVACDSSGGCADPNSTCFSISGGANPTGCYPTSQTCSGFSGGTTGSTTGSTGTGQTCDVCTTGADCSSGLICVDDGNGGGVCAPTCDPTSSPRCPSSFTCYSIQSGGGACFPDTSTVCGGSTSATTGGTTTGGTTTGGTTTGGTTGGSSGSSGTTGSCTPDTWANYAQAFFANNCAQCHSFASSHSQVKSNATSIESRIQGGSMPPSGGLSQSDIDRITTWLQCGAP